MSSDKLFPALGFGARVPPDVEVSHEFFLVWLGNCTVVVPFLVSNKFRMGTHIIHTAMALMASWRLMKAVYREFVLTVRQRAIVDDDNHQ